MAKVNTRKKLSASPAKKKTVAKKVAVKNTVKKTAPKKPTPKKTATKKITTKKVVKPATKKTPAKKPVKPAPKKIAAKPAPKKSQAKKIKTVAKPAKKSTPASAKKTSPARTVKPTVKAAAPSKATPTTNAKKPSIPMSKNASATTTAAKPKKANGAYKSITLPEGYKPSEKEEYMNPQQVEYFRRKLLQWRSELLSESRETLDHLHDENWQQADIADRASLETEAGVELRTRNRYLKLISKIDAAIKRIEEGEYGYCEETGEPIGIKRLEARPVATLSIEAQERHEKMEKQYTDED